MIKYFALACVQKIERVEVLSETKHFITTRNGHRDKKIMDNMGYFDTWDEAKQFLIAHEEAAIEGLEHQIEIRKTNLAKINAFVEI